MRPRPHISLLASALVFGLASAGAARAQVTETSVTLKWTAPGDDSLSGRAARYELRWSTSPITTLAQFSAARPVSGLSAPQPAGAGESATVGGLVPSTTYWFAVRTFDEVGNGSALSNVLQATTSPSTDPERPAELPLSLLTAATSSVTVAWADVGDDSLTGIATAVEVRWSTAPIDETNWDVATRVYGEPPPGPPGTPQQVTANGLDRTSDLWFAARARDDVNRLSGVGTPLMVGHLLDTAPPATPTGASAALESPAHVRLRWAANSEPDLAGYVVYRALDASGPYAQVTASPIVTTDYLDSSPPDTLAVWYALSAVDATGNESARSTSLRVYLRGGEAWDVSTPYPNPCPVGGVATIPLAVPAAGPYDALVEIQDAAGQHVRSLRVTNVTPGSYALAWDGRNDAGRVCAPGVYRAWLRANGQAKLVRMLRTP
jgi:chitodextrinase